MIYIYKFLMMYSLMRVIKVLVPYKNISKTIFERLGYVKNSIEWVVIEEYTILKSVEWTLQVSIHYYQKIFPSDYACGKKLLNVQWFSTIYNGMVGVMTDNFFVQYLLFAESSPPERHSVCTFITILLFL